jgi:hypothetical protein
MQGMQTREYFQCDRCHIDCRLDSEAPGPIDAPRTAQLTIRHCQDSKGIVVFGKVMSFQERRGGLWVAVQRWIDAA